LSGSEGHRKTPWLFTYGLQHDVKAAHRRRLDLARDRRIHEIRLRQRLVVVLHVHVHRQPICFDWLRQRPNRAFCRAWAKTGKRIAASMAIIAITTRSSISVNPLRYQRRAMADLLR